MPTNSSKRSFKLERVVVLFMFIVAAVAFLIGFWTMSGEWFLCSLVWGVGGVFCWWMIHDE